VAEDKKELNSFILNFRHVLPHPPKKHRLEHRYTRAYWVAEKVKMGAQRRYLLNYYSFHL